MRFLGANPKCNATQPCSAPSRFVDSRGAPQPFQGAVPVFLNGGKAPGANGDVTLDQLKVTGAAGPNMPGTATCLQAPCNVVYPERPWFNG